MKTVYANPVSGLSYTQGDCEEDKTTFEIFYSSLSDLDSEICCDCTEDQINLLEKEYGSIR